MPQELPIGQVEKILQLLSEITGEAIKRPPTPLPTSSLAEGMTRLVRGEAAGSGVSGAGQMFTKNLDDATKFMANEPKGVVNMVDVPSNAAERGALPNKGITKVAGGVGGDTKQRAQESSFIVKKLAENKKQLLPAAIGSAAVAGSQDAAAQGASVNLQQMLDQYGMELVPDDSENEVIRQEQAKKFSSTKPDQLKGFVDEVKRRVSGFPFENPDARKAYDAKHPVDTQQGGMEDFVLGNSIPGGARSGSLVKDIINGPIPQLAKGVKNLVTGGGAAKAIQEIPEAAIAEKVPAMPKPGTSRSTLEGQFKYTPSWKETPPPSPPEEPVPAEVPPNLKKSWLNPSTREAALKLLKGGGKAALYGYGADKIIEAIFGKK